MENREINIDLIKIMACCGVVALHTVDENLGIINRVIVLLSTMAIPLFFVVNGYLMFKKENITYSYVFQKIRKILIVCFAWECLHALAYFLYYHERRNFISSFILDFFQKGLFFHFWFFGVLILINLLLPLLRKLERKNVPKYVLLTMLFGLIGMGIEVVSLIMKEQILLNVIQTFRMWTWLFYFLIGGLISVKRDSIIRNMRCRNGKKLILVWLCAVTLSSIWQWEIGNKIFGGLKIEAFYGSVFVVVAVILTFALGVVLMEIPSSGHQKIVGISGKIMGIYIIHPFILAVIKKYIPVVEESAYINVFWWIITVIMSYMIVWGINKIPVLKELIKI